MKVENLCMKNFYCEDIYNRRRRETREVTVGEVRMGGKNPIRVQSMVTHSTPDTRGCVEEILQLADAGCEIVRLTAQTRAYAANLEAIVRGVRGAGCRVPLVADIHFKPDAAMEAAKWVEKIRINPGNYTDRRVDTEYERGEERVRREFGPLVRFCREYGRAIRLGVNHGSLSPRMLARYGDTPEGMVESAMEFARVARGEGFHALVFSMKASDARVMVRAYRLLVRRLAEEGEDWNYPIHLGVTEAGEGMDARVKSALGIGSLLADGIGDTLRVSLTEDAVAEVAPGFELAHLFAQPQKVVMPNEGGKMPYDPMGYERRRCDAGLRTDGVDVGAGQPVRVVLPEAVMRGLPDGTQDEILKRMPAEICYERAGVTEVDPRDEEQMARLREMPGKLVAVRDGTDIPPVQAQRLLAARLAPQHAVLLKDTLMPGEQTTAQGTETPETAVGVNIGALLVDGIGDAVSVRSVTDPMRALRLAYGVLQAAGVRVSGAVFVSCPSCGRTLYDIQTAVKKIRAATEHLVGVKIAVMGCVVNGPGEMGDADFGYVGGAPGKINLYVGKKPVKRNIPEEDAVEELVRVIEEYS